MKIPDYDNTIEVKSPTNVLLNKIGLFKQGWDIGDWIMEDIFNYPMNIVCYAKLDHS